MLVDEIKARCEEVASDDTCYWTGYRQVKGVQPLFGHCGAVAYTVQKILGGKVVEGSVVGTRHFWNLLDNDIELDLTSEQFGGDGLRPVVPWKRVSPERKTVNPRFKLFYKRYLDRA